MKIAITLALAFASVSFVFGKSYHQTHEAPIQYHHAAMQRYHAMQQQKKQQQAVEAVEAKGTHGHEEEHYVDYHGHPKYHFEYAVHDPHHHDFKQQWEHRDGKNVKGEYQVVQPDGKTRIVSYEAGKHGVNYKVEYVHGPVANSAKY